MRKRVQTGIKELDKMLSGGFLETDTVLLSGAAGTGKTNLALQYLYNGASKYGQRGAYITFEEMSDRIYQDAANFGMDLEKKESENEIRIVSTSPEVLLDSDALFNDILDLKPQRVVVDSISHYEMFKKTDTRNEVYKLIRFFKTKGMTSILIHEAQAGIGQALSPAEHGFSFLVDAVVVLRYVEIESAIRKAITVLKMRGSDHDKRLRELMIDSNGVEIGEAFAQWEGIFTGTPRKSFEGKFSGAFGGI